MDILQGDASLARKVLGWDFTINFKELVSEMVDAELGRLTSMTNQQAAARDRIQSP